MYKNGGSIVHSGLVVEAGVLEDGTDAVIESKWREGGLYLHHPNDTLNYGDTWEIYHKKTGEGTERNWLHTFLLNRYETDSGNWIPVYPGWWEAAGNQIAVNTIPAKTDKEYRNTKMGSCLSDKVRTAVDARGNQVGPTWSYNCHGFTFTGEQDG